MPTEIHIVQDDQGGITVTVDGQETAAEGEEDALAIVAEALVGETGEEPEPEGQPEEQEGEGASQGSNQLPMTEEDFAGGFNAVRAGGLNGR